MLFLKRTALLFSILIGFTFLFGCNTGTIKDLENRIAELENQASDTVFVSTTDTLIITNTDTIYVSNLDTLYIFDTVYLANDSVMIGDVRLFTQEMIDEFGASGIKKVVGRLEIQVDETVSLDGLLNLKEVIGGLVMHNYGTDFQGLNNLESVSELIIDGPYINSIAGLDALVRVGILSVSGTLLTDLGNGQVTGVYQLNITNNLLLTDFCGVKAIVENMETNSFYYFINGNAFNPQSSVEIVGCN